MNFWDTKFSENSFLYGREPNTFKDEFSSLEVQIGVEKERQVSEGVGHNGMSAVVQFIGKKLEILH